MSLAILFHFLCARHVSDINISITRSLRLFCWITTSVVLFLVRCMLEFRCGWFGVVSVLQAEAQLLCFILQHGYKWHQVGPLFFNYHNDARSNKHKNHKIFTIKKHKEQCAGWIAWTLHKSLGKQCHSISTYSCNNSAVCSSVNNGYVYSRFLRCVKTINFPTGIMHHFKLAEVL